jgi:hypothetical protein
LTFSLLVIEIGAQEMPFILFGCALCAASLFVYVFYNPGQLATGEAKTRHGYLQERKDATYENLRDLNFEFKAGKLGEVDYARQRASLEDEAAAILAEMEAIEKTRLRSPSEKRGRRA